MTKSDFNCMFSEYENKRNGFDAASHFALGYLLGLEDSSDDEKFLSEARALLSAFREFINGNL